MNINDIKKKFKYFTLDHVLPSEIGDILVDNHQAFISKYFDLEQKILIYRYALDDITYLIKILKNEKEPVLVPFVDKNLVPILEGAGLLVRNVFKDYSKYGFDDVKEIEHFDFLDINEAEKASDLTKKAINSSRGFFGQTESWIKGWMLGTIEDIIETGVKNQAIIVKRDQEKLIGLICMGLYAHDKENGPILWVRELVVDKDYQGQKIGQTLLKEALSYGKKLGAKKAFLLVDELNSSAIHIYKKHGFVAKDDDGQIDMIYNES